MYMGIAAEGWTSVIAKQQALGLGGRFASGG